MAIAESLSKAWEYELRLVRDSYAGPRERKYVYASGRRLCTRSMALDLLFPEEWNEPDADGMERMRRGKEREEAINDRLRAISRKAELEFEISSQQERFEIRDRSGRVVIVGKIDGRIKLKAEKVDGVYEVKSGESWRGVTRLDDLERSPWTRHALDQLLSYLYAKSLPWGVLIIDKPGMPVFLEVRLEDHLDRVEAFLQQATIAVDVLEGKADLPTFTQDAGECRRCCHYGKSCAPPILGGLGLSVITDERLIQLAEVRDKNLEAHEEFARADAELKKSLRGTELAVMGDFQIKGKWSGKKVFEPPPAIAEQIEEWKNEYTIHKPQQIFYLDIERTNG